VNLDQSGSFEQQHRSKEEQQLQEHVIRVVAEHMLQQESVDVFTNPGDIQTHGLGSHDEVLYPDLFTKVGNRLTIVCAVETPSTVSEKSLDKWQNYADLAASFLLVVPEQCKQIAQTLLDENCISSEGIFVYEQTAP